MQLADELKLFLRGDVLADDVTLTTYSHDASLFEVKPQVVVRPKDTEDVKNIVRFVSQKKKTNPGLSLTARAAGTDMTGGPLTESIVLDFSKYFNHLGEVSKEGEINTEPGVYYRDFEKATLAKNFIFPSYPASKGLCAMGGIVNNNSGGERSLVYGKTEQYVTELKMILRDGKEYTFRKFSKKELQAKMRLRTVEGEIYRKLFKLVDSNYDLIKSAKPGVSKNSAGLNIWDIWDKKYFNPVKLFVGAQGTLGLMTEAKIQLVKTKSHSGMLVVFLKDLHSVAKLVQEVLPFKPTSFESFDDHTLRLALRFLPGFLKLLGAKNLLSLGLKFLPDFWLILTQGMPKLILLVEFEGDNQKEVDTKIETLYKKLAHFGIKMRIARTTEEAAKYWAIRRESFNLLRNKVRDKRTAPFIDDVIVEPQYLPEFLPQLYAILDRYQLLYTIAGHVGNGNFHVIPLMDLMQESERAKIPKAAEEVYNLTLKFGGSLSAEHNDGLIRGPYLEAMYGEKVMKIFREIKKIFDPQDIFNPGKKMEANLKYALAHIKHG